MNPIKRNVRIIFALAIVILITATPAFGVPSEWKLKLQIILSLAIIVTTFLLHRALTARLRAQSPQVEKITEAFRESGMRAGNSQITDRV